MAQNKQNNEPLDWMKVYEEADRASHRALVRDAARHRRERLAAERKARADTTATPPEGSSAPEETPTGD